MKKIIYHFLVLPLLLLAACSNDDGEGTIMISKDQLKQSAYADDVEKGITFTATEAWRTEVDYVGTKAETTPEQWVSLDPPSGEAGEVTIKVVLSTNYTGADRKASIRILCGETVITVTIEQKSVTEKGEIPDDEINAPGEFKNLVSKIEIETTISYSQTEKSRSEWIFTYDDRNRIVSFEGYDIYNEKREIDWSYTFTYSGNTIHSLEKLYESDSDEIYESRGTYTLDDNQNVIEWKEEYNETGTPEENHGKITYEDGYFASSESTVSESDPSIDQAIWENGNLVSAVYEDHYTYVSTMEYGDTPNCANLDFNYLLAGTEWLYCLAFEGEGMKPFGYFGHRSRNLMTKEKDSHNGHYYIYEYKTDNEGNITEIKVTSHDSDGKVEEQNIYKISYISAK